MNCNESYFVRISCCTCNLLDSAFSLATNLIYWLKRSIVFNYLFEIGAEYFYSGFYVTNRILDPICRMFTNQIMPFTCRICLYKAFGKYFLQKYINCVSIYII
ncbi:hypothetical protein ACOSP7_031078 [Xanthoceras sorbifolium]